MKLVFANADDLKQQIRKSDQGIPKEMLQHYESLPIMTAGAY
jgi:hypothetical protein